MEMAYEIASERGHASLQNINKQPYPCPTPEKKTVPHSLTKVTQHWLQFLR